MTANLTLPPDPEPRKTRPTTREQRALALYRERRHEIERIDDDAYLVPSCSAAGAFYRVDYAAETCSCPDSTIRRELCKHVLTVGIHRAKRRAKRAGCSGCGERLPLRDLVEVGREQAEATLGVREGERYCPGCARDVGIA